MKPAGAIIVVIDEDEIARKLLCALLNNVGFICLSSSGGNSAVRLLETIAADIVVIDINMKIKNCFETIRIINKRWPDIKNIAISLLSDHRGYAELSMFYGVHIPLTKPVTTSELLCAVYCCLKNSNGPQYNYAVNQSLSQKVCLQGSAAPVTSVR